MSDPLRVLLVGGRSGGHVYPLIAVARILAGRGPCELTFVGEAGRMEETLVPREGFALRTLRIPPASPTWRRLLGLPGWLGVFAEARRLVAELRPEVIVGSGGQVCAPVMLAGRRAGLPLLLLEPNAVPGAANRWIARRARPEIVGLLMAEAGPRFGVDLRYETVGYPLRPEVLSTERRDAAARLGLDPAATTLLVFGGSQGSGKINETLVAALPGLTDPVFAGLQVVHAGGWINARTLDDAARAALPVRYRYFEYLHEMADALACADLVLGRAGAAGLAELTALGLPAVLVPLPKVSDDHQRRNAEWMSRAGAAVLVPDDELTPDGLTALLTELLGNAERRASMAAASRSLGRPDAGDRVVDYLLALSRPEGAWPNSSSS